MSEKVRVAWVSQHTPLQAQIEKLEEWFGNNYTLHQIAQTFTSAEQVYEELEQIHADIAIVVLPYSMTARLLDINRNNVVFLQPVMDKLHTCSPPCKDFNPKTDTWIKGRHYRFTGRYDQIIEVRVVRQPFNGANFTRSR